MLKISEFAKLCKTTRRTLIFYDKKGLFLPAKRAENGYRFYEPDQLYQYELISSLRQIGLSIEEIKSLIKLEENDLQKYLEGYRQRIKKEIEHLQFLDQLLEQPKEQVSSQNLAINKVEIRTEAAQLFWCSDREENCEAEDIAKLYSNFMENLGETVKLLPSRTGFLAELCLDNVNDYMTSSFRFIKEKTEQIPRSLNTCLEKPAGKYLTVKVSATEEDILKGLNLIKTFAQQEGYLLGNFLWQMNVDSQLVKNGSSEYQVLQYQCLDGENERLFKC